MIDIFETQMDKFKSSDPIEFLKSNVSQRLGLRQTLRYDVISMMWDECRYQQSYHLNEMSPWCAVGVSARVIIYCQAKFIYFFFTGI